MTQSEAILEYIDGTLDHDAEQALFDSMARHPELRLTLRQFISIGSAVHADREAYAPPAHVEQALLSGLGLAPSSMGAAIAPSAARGLLARFGGKLGGMALSFLAGVLLAGSMVYWMTRDGASPVAGRPAASGASVATNGTLPAAGTGSSASIVTGESAGARGASSALTAGTATREEAGAPSAPHEGAIGKGTASSSNALASDPASFEGRSRRSDLLMARGSHADGASARDGARSIFSSDRSGGGSALDRFGAASSRPANGEGLPTQADLSGTPPVSPTIPAIGTARLRTASPEFIPSDRLGAPPAPRSITPSQSSPIDPASPAIARSAFAELRGKAGASLNPTNARSGSAPAFMNNLAVGAYLMIGPSLSVGIEGGSEAYDQVLNFDSGDTDRVEQRPSYIWGGVAGRYYLGTIPGIELRPFMQGTLGFTSAGPLGRIRLGAGYDLGVAALNIGVEASTLVYSFNGRPLMSGRLGATVGAEVRLW